jgi:hypothetical protein
MKNANEAQAPQEITVEQALYMKGKAFFTAMDEFRAVLDQAERVLIQQQLEAKEAKIVELTEAKDKKK